MKTESNLTEFIRYTFLNITGMIGLSCYILADTFFVSKGLGTDGLAALNLAIPIYSLVHGCGLMLGMGGATRYSIFRGSGQHKGSEKIFSNIVYAAAFLAVIFLFLGMFLSKQITLLLGTDRNIFDMTRTYLRMILLFSPAFMMNDILVCFVRNDNNPKLSMAAMLTGSFSNIILDYLFIFPLDMGILGAVLATGLAPILSMFVLSWHFIRKQNQFRFQRTAFMPGLTANAISLGVPSLIAEVASGIVMILFNIIILRLQGNTGVAAYGVIANLSLVVTSIHTGIAQGAQPLISRAYGNREQHTVRQILKYAVTTMLLLSAFIYFAFLLLADPITGIFNSEQNIQLQQIAVTGLKLYFTGVPFAGFNIILAIYFAATERALPAQAISLSRGLFLIIPVAFFLSFLAGMTGVWLAYPVTESIVSIIGIILYKEL